MATGPQQVSVKGRSVRYYEWGKPERRTVFLLHGGFGAADLHWNEAGRQLALDYHVIAPDMPGYGGTDPLPNMTIAGLVQWLHDLIDVLEQERVVAVGNGFSGLVARLLAVKYPRQVSALVLVNGGVIPKVNKTAAFIAGLPVVGSMLFRRLAGRMAKRDELKLAIQDEALMTDSVVEQIRSEQTALANFMRALATSPRPEKTVPTVPTLLLWGEEDAITPRAVGEHIHRAIPGSKLELIAQVRHMPHLEVPDIFVWQISKFLESLP
jgi:3-oxoadipate enol-lactonase